MGRRMTQQPSDMALYKPHIILDSYARLACLAFLCHQYTLGDSSLRRAECSHPCYGAVQYFTPTLPLFLDRASLFARVPSGLTFYSIMHMETKFILGLTQLHIAPAPRT